jgi:lipoyl(octanoyl) transferase
MPANTLSTLDLLSLGTLPYREAFQLQLELHREVASGEREGVLLLLEHPPVLTLGKNADLSFVLRDPEELRDLGVAFERSDRGGEVTAHMPGQLVIYPILPLQRLRLPPKLYVEKLLATVIMTLLDFGIEAYSDNEQPGVWIGTNKLCAVGVRIKERVSLHGLALNIHNSLSLFQSIIPCGLQGRGVCSMQTVLGVAPTRAVVEAQFIKRFCEVFGWSRSRSLSRQERDHAALRQCVMQRLAKECQTP